MKEIHDTLSLLRLNSNDFYTEREVLTLTFIVYLAKIMIL